MSIASCKQYIFQLIDTIDWSQFVDIVHLYIYIYMVELNAFVSWDIWYKLFYFISKKNRILSQQWRNLTASNWWCCGFGCDFVCGFYLEKLFNLRQLMLIGDTSQVYYQLSTRTINQHFYCANMAKDKHTWDKHWTCFWANHKNVLRMIRIFGKIVLTVYRIQYVEIVCCKNVLGFNAINMFSSMYVAVR